jgi:hypothetical protein
MVDATYAINATLSGQSVDARLMRLPMKRANRLWTGDLRFAFMAEVSCKYRLTESASIQ